MCAVLPVRAQPLEIPYSDDFIGITAYKWRGGYKTSIRAQVYYMTQWLNYPDIPLKTHSKSGEYVMDSEAFKLVIWKIRGVMRMSIYQKYAEDADRVLYFIFPKSLK